MKKVESATSKREGQAGRRAQAPEAEGRREDPLSDLQQALGNRALSELLGAPVQCSFLDDLWSAWGGGEPYGYKPYDVPQVSTYEGTGFNRTGGEVRTYEGTGGAGGGGRIGNPTYVPPTGGMSLEGGTPWMLGPADAGGEPAGYEVGGGGLGGEVGGFDDGTPFLGPGGLIDEGPGSAGYQVGGGGEVGGFDDGTPFLGPGGLIDEGPGSAGYQVGGGGGLGGEVGPAGYEVSPEGVPATGGGYFGPGGGGGEWGTGDWDAGGWAKEKWEHSSAKGWWDIASDPETSVEEKIRRGGNKAVDNAARNVGKVAEGAEQVWDWGTEGAKEIWDTGEKGAEQLWDWGTEGAEQVWDAASDVASGAGEAAGEAWDWGTEKAGEAWDSASETASDVGSAVGGAAESAWDWATGGGEEDWWQMKPEEGAQAKIEGAIQRQGLEEEEPLQGKADVQRQEEEEPLQGKAEGQPPVQCGALIPEEEEGEEEAAAEQEEEAAAGPRQPAFGGFPQPVNILGPAAVAEAVLQPPMHHQPPMAGPPAPQEAQPAAGGGGVFAPEQEEEEEAAAEQEHEEEAAAGPRQPAFGGFPQPINVMGPAAVAEAALQPPMHPWRPPMAGPPAPQEAEPAAGGIWEQMRRLFGVGAGAQRKTAPEEGAQAPVTPELMRAIEGERGGGQPLEEGLRRQAEEALGLDLQGVRLHTGAEADELAESLRAKAFTTGKDIFFRSRHFDPHSSAGRELIGHELTHVIQQHEGLTEPAGRVGDRYEQEADRVGAALFGQEGPGHSPAPTAAPAGGVQAKAEGAGLLGPLAPVVGNRAMCGLLDRQAQPRRTPEEQGLQKQEDEPFLLAEELMAHEKEQEARYRPHYPEGERRPRRSIIPGVPMPGRLRDVPEVEKVIPEEEKLQRQPEEEEEPLQAKSEAPIQARLVTSIEEDRLRTQMSAPTQRPERPTVEQIATSGPPGHVTDVPEATLKPGPKVEAGLPGPPTVEQIASPGPPGHVTDVPEAAPKPGPKVEAAPSGSPMAEQIAAPGPPGHVTDVPEATAKPEPKVEAGLPGPPTVEQMATSGPSGHVTDVPEATAKPEPKVEAGPSGPPTVEQMAAPGPKPKGRIEGTIERIPAKPKGRIVGTIERKRPKPKGRIEGTIERIPAKPKGRIVGEIERRRKDEER